MVNAMVAAPDHTGGGGGGGSSRGNANNKDKELRGLDKELIEKINNLVVNTGEQVTFDNIAGLEHAKEAVHELVILPMIRPDLFTGLLVHPRGLLLFVGSRGTFKLCLVTLTGLVS